MFSQIFCIYDPMRTNTTYRTSITCRLSITLWQTSLMTLCHPQCTIKRTCNVSRLVANNDTLFCIIIHFLKLVSWRCVIHDALLDVRCASIDCRQLYIAWYNSNIFETYIRTSSHPWCVIWCTCDVSRLAADNYTLFGRILKFLETHIRISSHSRCVSKSTCDVSLLAGSNVTLFDTVIIFLESHIMTLSHSRCVIRRTCDVSRSDAYNYTLLGIIIIYFLKLISGRRIIHNVWSGARSMRIDWLSSIMHCLV